MKKLLVIALGLALAGHAGQGQAFGLPKLTNPLAGSSSGGDVSGQVATFQESALTSNQLMANSSVYLLRALVSKERGAELQKQLDAINQISDPKEKNAQLAKLVASNKSELATLEQDKKVRDQLKKASSEKKKAMGAGLFNLALGLLKINQLQQSGTAIVDGVKSNPAEALKTGPVAATLPVLADLASNGKSLVDTGSKLIKAADIKVELPTAADVTAQPLDNGVFDAP